MPESLAMPLAMLYGELRSRLWSERGQTLAEYGLVLTIVAVGVVIPTLILFRIELISAYSSASDCLLGGC